LPMPPDVCRLLAGRSDASCRSLKPAPAPRARAGAITPSPQPSAFQSVEVSAKPSPVERHQAARPRATICAEGGQGSREGLSGGATPLAVNIHQTTRFSPSKNMASLVEGVQKTPRLEKSPISKKGRPFFLALEKQFAPRGLNPKRRDELGRYGLRSGEPSRQADASNDGIMRLGIVCFYSNKTTL